MQQIDSSYPADFSVAYDVTLGDFATQVAPKIYELYIREYGKSCQDNMLDLCCGSGQLANFFLSKGFFVTGMDSSEKMLYLAQKNNSNYINQCEWILADISEFKLKKSFRLITSTFSSLNLLQSSTQLINCFNGVYDHLEDNGIFIFDITTECGAQLYDHFLIRDMESYTLITNGYFEKSRGKALLHFLGFYKETNDLYKKFEYHQTSTIFKVEYVENLLKQKGFRHIRYFIYGTKEMLLVSKPEDFPNVVVCAQK